jgi:hypothetical protein
MRVALATDVATAVAEKLSAMQTAGFFASRKAHAEFKAFDKLMSAVAANDRVPAMSSHRKPKTNKNNPAQMALGSVMATSLGPETLSG